MSNDAKKGSPNAKNDRDRARLRGKGREADYRPGSDEGATFTGEIGTRGDDLSLRGYTTPGAAKAEEEKRYHPPGASPPESR